MTTNSALIASYEFETQRKKWLNLLQKIKKAYVNIVRENNLRMNWICVNFSFINRSLHPLTRTAFRGGFKVHHLRLGTVPKLGQSFEYLLHCNPIEWNSEVTIYLTISNYHSNKRNKKESREEIYITTDNYGVNFVHEPVSNQVDQKVYHNV